MADENNSPTDEYKNAFCFEVTVAGGGTINQAFTRVSGVVSSSEAMEYMQGTDGYVRKNPGRVVFEDVTLERVYNGLDDFYEWRNKIEAGGSEKKDVEIRMQDRKGTDVRHMTLKDAWPIRWELPELDATGSSPATERITLSCSHVVHNPLTTDDE